MKKIVTTAIIFLVSNISFPCQSFGQDAKIVAVPEPQASLSQMSLQKAIDLAGQNNGEIKAKEFSFEQSKDLKNKAVMQGVLPSVSVDFNRGDRKYKIGSNKSIDGSVDTRDINVSQNLFNGGKNFFDYKRAKSIEEKSRFELMSKKQEIVLQVIKAYIDILKINDLLSLGEENVKSYADILEYTKKKAGARDASKADLARSEADYIAAFNNQESLKNNLASAKANFVRLTGSRDDETNNLVKFSDEKINQKRDFLNKVKIVDEALLNNPDLKAVAQNYEATKHETSMAKSSFSPTATLDLQSSEDNKSIYFNNQTQRNDSVFLNFHIPIFSQGVEYSNLSYSKNREAEEKYNLENTRRKIIESSTLYLSDMNNFYQNYNSAIESEKANQVYFESTRIEEHYGTKSILDVLISKQQFYQSQTSKINYYYDYIMAVFKLEALIGRL